MPLPKLLKPFLHKSQRRNNKSNKDVVTPPPVTAVKDVVLSPALPYSPPKRTNSQHVNGNGDPVIEVDTAVEEEDGSSAKSNESIMEEQQEEEQVEEEENTTTTAVVLHEKPTAFELCDNDLIVESVKEVEEEEEGEEIDYDGEMMRDNNDNDMTMYKANNTATTTSAEAIDFTSPLLEEDEEQQAATIVELMDEETQQETEETVAPPLTPASPATSTIATVEASTHQQPEIQEFYFIKPIQAEVLHTFFVSPKLDDEKKQAHFPMETTFKRHENNAGFTSTCKKVIRGAKSLIWKPDSPRHMKRTKSTLSTKFDNNGPTTPAGREANKESAFGSGNKQQEMVDETPIYRRRNTSGNYLASANEDQQGPLEGYKSPEIGTDAYDIKKLCDQSFFGRW